jgi:hypothetical protein
VVRSPRYFVAIEGRKANAAHAFPQTKTLAVKISDTSHLAKRVRLPLPLVRAVEQAWRGLRVAGCESFFEKGSALPTGTPDRLFPNVPLSPAPDARAKSSPVAKRSVTSLILRSEVRFLSGARKRAGSSADRA